MGQTAKTDEQDLIGKRAKYLAVLIDNSYRKTDLTDELDTPRSTVDRAIRELEENGLVHRVNGEFTTTLTGELAYKRYKHYAAFHDTLAAAKPTINQIEADVDIPLSLFDEAHVLGASPQLPEQPVMEAFDFVERSPYLHGLAPVALSIYTDMIQELMMNGTQEFETVATETVHKMLQDALSNGFEAIAESDSFNFYVSSEDFPYALWFVEPDGVKHVGLTVYNETGAIGTIVSSDEQAVQWGHDQYQEYLDNAEQVL